MHHRQSYELREGVIFSALILLIDRSFMEEEVFLCGIGHLSWNIALCERLSPSPAMMAFRMKCTCCAHSTLLLNEDIRLAS